ncbi:MAG: hypothetical protein QOJ11_681 [Frankiales bacterium]|jgi:uncharacterized protein (DUF58 family)|nr:hypothetical protein [Frankiales bacterium]
MGRLGSLLPYAALPAAFLAQSERMPLVAVVALACGLSPLAGLTGLKALDMKWEWPGGRSWYVGDTVFLRTTFTNSGSRATPVLTVRQQSPGLPTPDLTVPMLKPGETATVQAPLLLSARRGPAPIGRSIHLHNRLSGRGHPVKEAQTQQLLPAVRPRPDLPPLRLLDPLARPAEEGLGTGRRGTADPLLLRHFASGDQVSSVHWRSTARAGLPVVMEREELACGVLVLLVAATGEGAAWEAAVARAAGMVQAAATLAVPLVVLAAAPARQLEGSPTQDVVQDWLAGLVLAGPAEPALLERAVSSAAGGLVAVLSADPLLAPAVAGAAACSVVDLLVTTW